MGPVAALASGMTVLATGSDSGGSLRSPASFTGTVGFKPPYGTIPTIFPASLDPFWQDGALARTVSDCALLHEVLAGHDLTDMASLVRGPRPPAAPSPVRVAVLTNLGNYRVDREIAHDVARRRRRARPRGFCGGVGRAGFEQQRINDYPTAVLSWMVP